MEMLCNVLRIAELDGSMQVEEGDYVKVNDDGTKENISYYDYLMNMGFPKSYCEKVSALVYSANNK